VGTAHSFTDYAGIVRLIPDPCTRVIGRLVHAAPARRASWGGRPTPAAGCKLLQVASRKLLSPRWSSPHTQSNNPSVVASMDCVGGVVCVCGGLTALGVSEQAFKKTKNQKMVWFPLRQSNATATVSNIFSAAQRSGHSARSFCDFCHRRIIRQTRQREMNPEIPKWQKKNKNRKAALF